MSEKGIAIVDQPTGTMVATFDAVEKTAGNIARVIQLTGHAARQVELNLIRDGYDAPDSPNLYFTRTYATMDTELPVADSGFRMVPYYNNVLIGFGGTTNQVSRLNLSAPTPAWELGYFTAIPSGITGLAGIYQDYSNLGWVYLIGKNKKVVRGYVSADGTITWTTTIPDFPVDIFTDISMFVGGSNLYAFMNGDSETVYSLDLNNVAAGWTVAGFESPESKGVAASRDSMAYFWGAVTGTLYRKNLNVSGDWEAVTISDGDALNDASLVITNTYIWILGGQDTFLNLNGTVRMIPIEDLDPAAPISYIELFGADVPRINAGAFTPFGDNFYLYGGKDENGADLASIDAYTIVPPDVLENPIMVGDKTTLIVEPFIDDVSKLVSAKVTPIVYEPDPDFPKGYRVSAILETKTVVKPPVDFVTFYVEGDSSLNGLCELRWDISGHYMIGLHLTELSCAGGYLSIKAGVI